MLCLCDREATHATLLDQIVPAAYPDPVASRAKGNGWHQRDADRWLQHLAAEMRRRDTQDIAWWELALGVPRAVREAVGIVFGLVVGITAWKAGLRHRRCWPQFS